VTSNGSVNRSPVSRRPAPASASVIIPTYRRPASLVRCLRAVVEQVEPPDEVIVVSRVGDEKTAQALEEVTSQLLRKVAVCEGGQLAALAAGVQVAHGQILAFTDDDAVPRLGWMNRIKQHFGDPTVGAVGGRDIVQTEPPRPLQTDVGRITSWGKLIGNHHLGVGPARDVAVLKGVNMAFRREAFALPLGLRGEGAQVHQEVSMCLACARAGWRIVYDPSVAVDHYPAPRFGRDQRGRPSASAVRHAAYNYVVSLLTWRPELRRRRALFGLLVGDRAIPGVARAGLALMRRERDVLFALPHSLAGQVDALADAARGRTVRMRREFGTKPGPRGAGNGRPR
jgi:cellulose synthase/poly-beta-1,6-N-acetylglucosamine synthase-like glycosyltransferase